MTTEDSKIDGRRKKTGGRQKGSVNKLTADLKAIILGALEDNGGQKYLAIQAIEQPVAFMTLLGKVLPKDINLNTSPEERLKKMTEEQLLELLSTLTRGRTGRPSRERAGSETTH